MAYTAAGVLIVIGAVVAVLGFLAGGELVWTIVGLAAVLAGGGLSLVANRSRA